MLTSLSRKLVLTCLITAAAEASISHVQAQEGCHAEEQLTSDPTDDPISEGEMRQARATAKKLGPALELAPLKADKWGYKVEALNPEKVEKTLVRLRASMNLDGPGFRSLFLVIERYLLNAKGSDGRLRPLSDLLKITEAHLRVIVNFLIQLDTLFIAENPTDSWPKFLRDAARARTLLKGDLAGRALAPHVESFIDDHLAKVLNIRSRFARLSLDESGNQLTLLSPVGVYKINLRRGVKNRAAIASPQVVVTERWGRQHDSTIRAIIDVDITDQKASAYLRTMLRADTFLHPHLTPPTLDVFPTPVLLSEMQEDVVAQLLAEDRAAERELIDKNIDGPVKLAYQVTTGAGKTPIASAYLTDLIQERWDGRQPRIVFIVENTQILNQTAISFHRDLGIPVDRIYLMYGAGPFTEMESPSGALRFKSGSDVVPDGDWEIVLTTRSSLHGRDQWLHGEILKENRAPAAARHPFALFIDEAHHLEYDEGQFNSILEYLTPHLRREDRIIGASATFSSKLRNIVTEVFDGHIVGNHLYGAEKDQLRRGEDLDFLALKQFMRATIDGYINPVDEKSFTLVRGTTTAQMLRDRLHRENVADEHLYDTVGNLIRGMRSNNITDRWLFFEAKQTRAEASALLLQKKFGESSTRYMHSGLSLAEQRDRLDWLRDSGPHRGSRNHHKQLVTVSQAIEGTDIRGTNGSAVMRNLGSDRVVQQVLGRGARLEAFKTSMRLADVTGRVLEYLEGSGELWNLGRAPIEDLNVEIWRGPAPAFVVPPTKDEITQRREAEVAQLRLLTTPTGAARTLGWNPTTGQTESVVNLRERFEQWFALFPEAQRKRYRELLDKNQWPAGVTEPRALKNLPEAVSVRYALNVLVMMFNEVKEAQRGYLAKIDDHERATALGVARLFYWLNAKFEFNVAPEMAYQPWGVNELFDFRLKVKYEKVLGSKPANQSIEHLFEFNAFHLLKLLPQLLSNRPHLITPEARAILARGRDRVEDAGRNHGSVQPVAAFYLAQLVNHWITLVPDLELRPWDLNGAFAKSPHPSLTEPSMHAFWTTFGQIDHALFDPNAEPLEAEKPARRARTRDLP